MGTLVTWAFSSSADRVRGLCDLRGAVVAVAHHQVLTVGPQPVQLMQSRPRRGFQAGDVPCRSCGSTRSESDEDRFGVGHDFDALTFAPGNRGYGPDLFYFVRHDQADCSTPSAPLRPSKPSAPSVTYR